MVIHTRNYSIDFAFAEDLSTCWLVEINILDIGERGNQECLLSTRASARRGNRGSHALLMYQVCVFRARMHCTTQHLLFMPRARIAQHDVNLVVPRDLHNHLTVGKRHREVNAMAWGLARQVSFNFHANRVRAPLPHHQLLCNSGMEEK